MRRSRSSHGILELLLLLGGGRATIALPARAAEPAEPAEPKGDERRERILKDHLDQVSGLAFLQPYAGATVGGLCVLGAGALAVGDLDSAEEARWPAVGATAACAAGSFASYLAPLDYQAPIVTASLTTGLALDMILATHFSDYVTPAIRVSMFQSCR